MLARMDVEKRKEHERRHQRLSTLVALHGEVDVTTQETRRIEGAPLSEGLVAIEVTLLSTPTQSSSPGLFLSTANFETD